MSGKYTTVTGVAEEVRRRKAAGEANREIGEHFGLTIVALGTSLPELVAALVKGHGALYLGNIIGANLFNLVLVSGAAITINPFNIPVSGTIAGINSSLVLDIPVMLAVMTILTIPTLIREKTARWQGILLLGIYGAFCVLQLVI